MRLWHKDLIDVLPRQQLLAQWRECCAIASNIATKGTPNHILVNKITDYSQIHFICYVSIVMDEMRKRGFKINEKSYLILSKNIAKGKVYFPVLHNDLSFLICDISDIYSDWMNERYLKQSFYNLQEKYDCGGITEEEWLLLKTKYSKLI